MFNVTFWFSDVDTRQFLQVLFLNHSAQSFTSTVYYNCHFSVS